MEALFHDAKFGGDLLVLAGVGSDGDFLREDVSGQRTLMASFVPVGMWVASFTMPLAPSPRLREVWKSENLTAMMLSVLLSSAAVETVEGCAGGSCGQNCDLSFGLSSARLPITAWWRKAFVRIIFARSSVPHHLNLPFTTWISCNLLFMFPQPLPLVVLLVRHVVRVSRPLRQDQTARLLPSVDPWLLHLSSPYLFSSLHSDN
jgi:hypothetical protein